MIQERVIWPNPDSDDEDNFSLETCCKITSFFRQYIEEGKKKNRFSISTYNVAFCVVLSLQDLDMCCVM